MAHSDPLPTQQGDVHAGVPAELVAAGFEEPEEVGRGGFGVVYRCSQRAGSCCRGEGADDRS
jgi:hypothetical protein